MGVEERAMVEANVRLVYWVVRRVAHQYPDVDEAELVSHGMYGLLKAVRGFDESRGFTFATYAVTVIKCTIATGYADRTGLNPKHGSDVRRLSLDAPNEAGSTIGDVIESDHDPEAAGLNAALLPQLKEHLAALPLHLRCVVPVLAGQQTGTAVAKGIGVSNMLVSTWVKQLEGHLRWSMGVEGAPRSTVSTPNRVLQGRLEQWLGIRRDGQPVRRRGRRRMTVSHGDVRRYNQGCRCQACGVARRDYQRRYYEERRTKWSIARSYLKAAA